MHEGPEVGGVTLAHSSTIRSVCSLSHPCVMYNHSYSGCGARVGDGVEKLEGILRAEEDARHLLREARDHAAEIARHAAAEAETIHSEARTDATRRIAAERTALMDSAADEAAQIAAKAERRLGAVVRAAEARIDQAVDAVVTEIMR